MKSDFHFHFYSRIVVMAVFAVSLILIQKSVPSNAGISLDPYPIGGWAWSESAGWLSLNCYNDFNTPGEYEDECGVGAWPGNLENYSLQVHSSGNVEGCIWAGNPLSGGAAAESLGWVCFSDQLPGEGPEKLLHDFGVTTSTDHLNALDEDTFASIIAQENWICDGGTDDGTSCSVNSDCDSNNCAFNDNGAWQLGFPIFSDISIVNPAEPDLPNSSNPIEGCFNCYEEAIAVCEENTNGGASIDCAVGDSIDQSICDDKEERRCSLNLGFACSVDSDCQQFTDWGDCIYGAVSHGLCIQSGIDYYCENCLEYFYYPGQCGNGGVGSGTSCKNNDDCAVSGEICEEISTCSNNIEAECTGSVDCGGNNCDLREIGSLKKLIGAYDCSDCSIASYDNACGINSYQGNINSCKACEEIYYSPGVMLDHNYYDLDLSSLPPDGDRAGLCGWAWNAWEDETSGLTYGLGWFQFGPRVVTSTKPYLSVDGGSIYSKGDIKGKYIPPFGYYNASYLIESGGSITNFISDSTLAGTYQGEFAYRPSINFLEYDASDKKYSNVLGSIDYYGLTEEFELDNGRSINKYGAQRHLFTDTNQDLSGDPPSGGDVYYYTNGLTIVNISSDIVIPVGTIANPNASGVIIVEGDLTINNNIEYSTDSISNLRNIPSLVWIIKGDLIINHAVSKLAGTFIVLGDKDRALSCNPPASGCGQIITCDGDAAQCENNSLTIQGSVLARYFNLNREWTGSDNSPAEKFVNDGRLQANPPTGFENFSKLIPRFTEN